MQRVLRSTACALLAAFAAGALAQPVEPVLAQARANKGPLLDTLKELVRIETGSRDRLYLAARLIMDLSQNKVR
jgi:hypothetical protein